MQLPTFIFTLLFLGVTYSLPAQKLTVMSYNIHHGANQREEDKLPEMAAFIRQSGADIIGLQEVDSVCHRSKGVDQMKVLAELTGMYYAFVRHFAYQGGAYGMGILSKYPIENIENIRMPLLQGKTPSTAMIKAEIILSNRKKISFSSAHFALDDLSRIKQAETVIAHLKDVKLPVIFTGDLNALPTTKEIQHLQNDLADTDPQHKHTFPAPQATKKIDYIFVRKNNLKRTVSHRVPVNAYSDHLAAVATFVVR